MKKTTLTPNIPLLRKIKKRILQRPRQFIMSDFFSDYLDGGGIDSPSHCESAIARQFNIHQSSVSRIVHNEYWV